MPKKIPARVWIEIDSRAVLRNFAALKKTFEGTKILAVVKADAYGFGQVETARIFSRAGVDMLGVTSVYEGIELRKNHITTPILVMAPLLDFEFSYAVKHNLIPAIGKLEDLTELIKAAGESGKKAFCHLEIDTGFGRTGFCPEELPHAAELLKGQGIVEVEGVFTHFKEAANKKITYRQYGKFREAVEYLEKEGINIVIKHCCNSAAALLYPEMRENMVRLGTLLYAQYPAGVEHKVPLEECWQAKTRIRNIKRIPRGESIGYGNAFTARSDSIIAVAPVGYTDGLAVYPQMKAKNFIDLVKMLAKTTLNYMKTDINFSYFTVNDKIASSVGRIGMELTLVDVTHIPEVNIGDEISFAMRRVTSSAAIPRVYLYENSESVIEYRGRTGIISEDDMHKNIY